MVPRSNTDGFIVQVLAHGGKSAGVGVMVSLNEFVTCAHVVNVAMGLDPRSQPVPRGFVQIAFPLLGAQRSGTPMLASVTLWRPPPQEGVDSGDLARLQIHSDVRPEPVPARLFPDPVRSGLKAQVFGFPTKPTRPGGAWAEVVVRNRVGGGRLQVDSARDSAIRIQPGFSGSPVIADSGHVVGIVSAAPSAASGERDAYAISVQELSTLVSSRDLQLPDAFSVLASGIRRAPVDTVNVLHLPDMLFGTWGTRGAGDTQPSEIDTDVLFDGLLADLADTVAYTETRPDLVIVAGNLATSGKPSEFSEAGRCLSKLGVALGLPRDRIVIVPGSRDVNRSDCAAYHLRQEGNEKRPLPPYWPKWEKFDAMFRDFYRDRDSISFTPDEPWTLFEIADLRVVVAGFNSTIAECHESQGYGGFIGGSQLKWFAERLARYRDEGWLRLAVVHHNVRGAAEPFGENLQDAVDLESHLGMNDSHGRRLIQILFHGRGTDGCVRVLPSGIVTVPAGASAMAASPFANIHPQQYQLVEINRDGMVQHGRIDNQRCGQWTTDLEVTESRSDWHAQSNHQFFDSVAVFSDPKEQLGWGTALDVQKPELADRPAALDGLLERVREVTSMLYQNASIVVCNSDGARYLRVTSKQIGEACVQWAVGVVEGVPDRASIDHFVSNVHERFAAADPGIMSKLVYFGESASLDLVQAAISSGVRLIRFLEYQGIADLSAFDKQQRHRLTADQRYPSRLYVPQRFLEDSRNEVRVIEGDLLERVLGWLADEQAMFIMVLGDFGRGKTFLLNELCRRLPDRLPSLQPILVELRHLEKRPSLDELLSQHLVRMGERQIDLEKLRYLIRSGRIALLFDGFDELVLRVSYDNAAQHLRSLIDAATGKAKIVLTSRTQHFRSEQQVRTALGERVIGRDVSRVVELADFSDDQIHDYLVKYFGGDAAAAAERYSLLGDVKDLLGLSHNPRMLSFIVGLDIERLREVRNAKGRISAADLYQELIARWLAYEAERQHHDGGRPSFTDGDRRQACEALAVALWSSPTGVITLTDLSAEVSHALTRMFDYGYSADQATQAIGSGSLLVRTADDEFDFVHRSVMEWLVADAAARCLKTGIPADVLSVQALSPLMIDFLGDLAGAELVMAWAEKTVQDGRAPAPARQNAAVIILRVSQNLNVRVNLAGIDLRGLDLTSANLRGADLQWADFRDMRLVDLDLQDADLRGADFTGAWMVKGSLVGTSLTGSRWERAALAGVAGIEGRLDAAELESAAVVGRDVAIPARSAGVRARSVAGDLGVNGLVAVSRHQLVEIVDTVSARTLRVLAGHTAPVLAVAVSRDGRFVASASADHSVRVWAMTGELRAVFPGHSVEVTAVTFAHDGTIVATGSADGMIRFWSIGGALISMLRVGQRDAVTAMAFSAQDDYLVCGTAQGSVSVLDTRHGGQTLLGEQSITVTCVATSSDGQLIATGCKDGIARLWDKSGAQLGAVPYPDASVEAVAFSQEGSLIVVTVGADQTRVCDAHRGVVVADIPQTALEVVLASNGQAAAVVLPGGELAAWHGVGEFQVIDGHRAEPIASVAFAPDGRLIATTGDRVWAWDTKTGRATVMKSDERSAGFGAILTDDGRWVALQDSTGAAHLWSTAPAKHVVTLRNVGRIRSLAVSRDGTTLATAGWNGPSRLWSALDGRELATLTTFESSRVTFAPDGQLAVTGFKDGSVSFYDQSASSSGYMHQAVDSVAFTSDGAQMASASRNGSVRIWDTRTRTLRRQIRADATIGVMFSPDGRWVAAVSSESMRVWDCATGEHRLSLSDSGGLVTGGAFSADGTQIATSAADGSIRLWNASGQLLATFVGYPNGTAVLLPDGSYKVQGDVGEGLWWAVKLCRFRPGEIDRFYPNIRRRAADELIVP